MIVYDKREDVMSKRKLEWPFIWNASLAKIGEPQLDLANPTKSRVWRVELRLGKKALKDLADIRGWSSFYQGVEAQLRTLVEKYELRQPGADKNRARWKIDPLWLVVSDLIEDGVFTDPIDVDEEALHAAELVEKQRQFLGLIASHLVTLAVLEGIGKDDLPDFLNETPTRIEHFLDMHPRGVNERMADAISKYGMLLE